MIGDQDQRVAIPASVKTKSPVFTGGIVHRSMSRSLTDRGLLRAALVVFGLFLAWRFLAGIATIVLLLSTGILLAVALSAPIEALHRRKIPRPVGAGLAALGVLALFGLGGYLLLPILREQASQLSFLFPAAIDSFRDRIGIFGGEGGVSTSTLVDWARRLLGGILGLFTALTFVVVGVVAAIFLALYLVVSPGPVVGWVLRFFPPDRRDRAQDILSKSRSALLQWLVGRLVSMAVIAMFSTIALYFIGIPGPVVLGLFSGLVSFVPYIGPIVSGVPPALLALLGDPIDALWVVLAYIAIQQVESNLITPLVMEKTASVHPTAVIVSVAVMGGAFGLLGTLLALPIAVVAGVLIEELWFRPLEQGPETPDAGVAREPG